VSQAQYQIYRDQVFNLVKSFIIHFPPAAYAMNEDLKIVKRAYVNEGDPTTWMYYKHLAGEYHTEDQSMQVTSMDTLQTIDFNKINLNTHRTTKKGYAFNSDYYKLLVRKFPNQESLIRGIVDPIDINVAINSEPFTILYHDSTLVEENEYNLISDIEVWMRNWWGRWNTDAYRVVDDLYAPAMFAKMVMMLPALVMNIRLRNARTPFVHSFHIRQHLASHGRLDKYFDFLTKRQMLYLYRNIEYIRKNTGKRETFDDLVEHVLTERSLPISEWVMRHNSEEQETEVMPKIEFFRRPVNMKHLSSGSDYIDIPQMLNREQPIARSNAMVQPVAQIQTQLKATNALKSVMSTKVLESSVLDLSDSLPYLLVDNLLNHWLHWAFTDRYVSSITVDNPKTGGSIVFTVKEAFIVFLYAYNKSFGIELKHIPPLVAQRVRKDPAPLISDLMGIVDPNLAHGDVVHQIASYWTPLLPQYISIPSFYDAVYEIWEQKIAQFNIFSNIEHSIGRAQGESVMEYLYTDVNIETWQYENYEQWISDRGLDIASYNDMESDLIATQIFTLCTGLGLTSSKSLHQIQEAMLKIMSQLSSYSIQLLQTINPVGVKIVNWPALRPGDYEGNLAHKEILFSVNFTVTDSSYRWTENMPIDLDEIGNNITIDHHDFREDDLDINLDIDFDDKISLYRTVNVNSSGVLDIYHNIPEIGTDTPIVDTDNYLPKNKTSLENGFKKSTVNHYVITPAEAAIIQAKFQAYENANAFPTPLSQLIPINTIPTLWPYL